MQKRSIGSKIGTIIFMIIVFICLKQIYGIYKENYFNDFVKAEYIANISEFKRDDKVKYDKYDSYRITSLEYNDAMFYKTVQVIPNTPYKVSCMIKTEGVETRKSNIHCRSWNLYCGYNRVLCYDKRNNRWMAKSRIFIRLQKQNRSKYRFSFRGI